MALKNLADKLYPVFMKNFVGESCKLFLSATDMKVRAIVKNASATSAEEAWKIALEDLQKTLAAEKIDPIILRADWVTSSEKMTWAQFNKLIEDTRRNYFRRGLALDSEYKFAFTEMEMNGNSMLYQGGKEGSPKCVFRQKFSDKYCQRRYGCDFPTPQAEDIVEVFDTQGAFVQVDEKPEIITGAGIYAGRRNASPIDAELFMKLAKNGANYLAKQVQKSGKFIYGYHTCFYKSISTYNTLRHISSAFAMLDVYGAYKKMPPMKLGKAIISAVEYAAKHYIKYRKLPDGTQAAYFVDTGVGEIKLGAIGVSLLAFVKYSELMHTKKYLPLMKDLATGILSMQKEDGSFYHVLNAEDFSIKEPFRIVFYDGEAVFGLLRLYSITKDERLLQAAELAFTRFINTNHWQNHDHWLSYAINELTMYKPEEKYFEFGISNFLDFLPFIYHRDTQFPTLMELMMAADTMLERIKNMPEMSKLLTRVNLNDFYSAMEKRAENLLNGYFWPELAMYFAKPDAIVGSFFIRHHAFRVRIDDVEHFLSGFVAYCRYLERRKNLPAPVPSQELLNGKAVGTGIFNINTTAENNPVINETKKIETPAEIQNTSIILENDLPEDNLDELKKKFHENNVEIFFMLRNIKKNAAGLELSAFRRAKLFKKYLGINVCLVTNEFQTDIAENLKHYELDNNYLNLYEHFKITSRKAKSPTEIIYYRADGSAALQEIYEKVDGKNILKSVKLIDENKIFNSKEALISYWLMSVFNDNTKIYILISDRPAEHAQTYMDIKSAGIKNIYVFHQIHSIHFREVQKDSETKIVSRYRYLVNDKIKADGIISCTEYQKNDILKRYNRNNIFVIPHAMRDFPPSKVETDPFKIIFVGRLTEEKNPAALLEAFKIVSQRVPQAHLHFYGAGPMKAELQKKVEIEGLADKVFFEGFVTNLSDVYSSAAVSVCTSRIEAFSMANQESLQMGCPVVSFDIKYGPSDMITDGENGFLIPPGNIQIMAEKIILILKNPDLQKKLSDNAPKAVEKYSQSVVAKKWANLISKFLPDKSVVTAKKIAENKAKIFYGGDVNLGRRMHFRVNEVEQFTEIDEIMAAADMRMVNLECVIATSGAQGVNKGEGGPYYFRARPEQIKILTEANIDVVLTANNHTGDYGNEALLEETGYLKEAGILYTGSGENFDEAIKPVYKTINGITVAIFSVDSSMRYFASDTDKAGIAFLSLKQPKLWEKVFADRLKDAHKKADVVIVAPHWGINNTDETSEAMKTIGRLLIDLGADAVLGCHSHKVHGVENYKNRPIVYDAGDFLFDSKGKHNGGCFDIEISEFGIEKITFVPLIVGYGQTTRTIGESAAAINKNFVELCNKFSTETVVTDKDMVEIIFNPPAREKVKNILPAPKKEWTAENVPDDAKISPQDFGFVKLIGCKVSPLGMQKRGMIFVETYWTVDKPTEKNCRFDITAVPKISGVMPKFGAGMEHEGCDWMYPTNLWQPGVIYYERFGLRPPNLKNMINCDLQVEIRVQADDKISEPYIDKNSVTLRIPNIPSYNQDVSESTDNSGAEKI